MPIYRAWINQPSTLQEDHHLHGKRCIVNDYGGQFVDIYFTEGPTHSMRINRRSLARGEHPNECPTCDLCASLEKRVAELEGQNKKLIAAVQGQEDKDSMNRARREVGP